MGTKGDFSYKVSKPNKRKTTGLGFLEILGLVIVSLIAIAIIVWVSIITTSIVIVAGAVAFFAFLIYSAFELIESNAGKFVAIVIILALAYRFFV